MEEPQAAAQPEVETGEQANEDRDAPKQEKYKKRKKMQWWEKRELVKQQKAEQGEPTESKEDVPKQIHVPNPDRIPKRKVAILCGFIGTGYSGFQRNPGVQTLEDELEKALHAANCISNDNYGDLSKVGWSRAARTDKGVHATGQVVCAKLQMETSEEEVAQAINSHLPPKFRVFAIRRVTRSFHAKMNCDHRCYEYVCPTFAFGVRGTGTHHVRHLETLGEQPPEEDVEKGDVPPLGAVRIVGVPALARPDGKPTTDLHLDDGLPTHEQFRLSTEQREEISAILALYEGTHNYHNFTIHRKSDDPSCKRFMMSVKCHDPFLVDNVEYIKLTFEGQSFMLHQIRKMTGMLIAVMRQCLPIEAMFAALLVPEERIKDIPTAPGYPLLLDKAVFVNYNKQHGGQHGNIELNEEEETAKEAFKHTILYPHIHAIEQQTFYMARWLHTLDKAQLDNVPQYVDTFRSYRAEAEANPDKLPQPARERLAQAAQLAGRLRRLVVVRAVL
eukprot:c45638_g1_i1.p1 GENE.c45638_g1_i1~~c45638_g1_i1.p1  ORF type:complete len:511 (+),score=127.77 c45638_g1_i1:28-1533(+)